MAQAAVWVLTIAVAAGTLLGMLHIQGIHRPPLTAGVAHAVAGGLGLVLLVLALRGPVRGAATGVASFGQMAAWLFGAALLSGALILARRRHAPNLSMIVHAGLAVTGYVLLLAWNALG